jgi:hypothetical protein
MKSDAPWAVKKALRWKLDDDGADCKVVSVGISHELNIIIILLGKRVVGSIQHHIGIFSAGMLLCMNVGGCLLHLGSSPE